MKENFKSALNFVLDHECVFAPGHDGDLNFVICEDVPGDSGGLTKYGIDQADHPGVNVRALDFLGASEIYRRGEWTRCCCDDLPVGYDLAVFDIAVNNGIRQAGRLLQRALNVTVDGFIGPKTIAAAQQGGERGLATLLANREQLYYDIIHARPGDSKFLRGWLDRNHDLARAVNVTTDSKGNVIT